METLSVLMTSISMAAGARRLADAPVAVEVRIAREQRDLHEGLVADELEVRFIAAICLP